MNIGPSCPEFFVGWDVGGWNCGRNRRSRDALVILDVDQKFIGTPWRGNLRTTINEAASSRNWLNEVFALCQTDLPAGDLRAVIAIDAPLGFSRAFVRLATRLEPEEPIGQSGVNPYLFRATERFLFDHGLRPLSAVKDMIGSQATKAMHVLAKFTPHVAECGVWTDDATLTAIEAYPSACKQSPLIGELLERYVVAERADPPEKQWVAEIDHRDKLDALTCALIAWLFSRRRDALVPPEPGVPDSEGWIWVPEDGLPKGCRRTIEIDP